MTIDTSAEQLFKRLDQLKQEILALRNESSHFTRIAQSLRNPLSWRIGGESVVGFGNNVADINLPDIRDLSDRVKVVHREHHDLTVNASVHLEGTAKKFYLQELDEVRNGYGENGENGRIS